MDIELNSADVQAVVRQVLESMMGQTPAAGTQPLAVSIPRTAHVAMLTSLEHFEVKEYPMPEVGDRKSVV